MPDITTKTELLRALLVEQFAHPIRTDNPCRDLTPAEQAENRQALAAALDGNDAEDERPSLTVISSQEVA